MKFDSNEELVHWMEDQGLSPFTLLKVTPKPTAAGKKLPAKVLMEWGLEDLEYEGDREKFLAWQLTAEKVKVFRCEGTLDRFEECNTELGEEGGIDLRLEAGGVLFLRCQRLVVGEPVERFRKGQPRPHHGEFHLELDLSTTTLGELRGWFGVPRELSCLRHRTEEVLGDALKLTEGQHISMEDGAGHSILWLNVQRNRFTIARGKWATDQLWTDIWSKIKSVPGVTEVSSRDLVCAPAEWPDQPPPKPASQVWPNIYGVTCDFAEMTLDDLRKCLGIAATTPFAFEDEDALEPRPTLKLGEAARHGGQDVNGFFQNASAQRMVKCRFDLREGQLVFQRERACDDATWLGVWRAPKGLPGVTEMHSRTTTSPPDPWPEEPPAR